MFEFSKQPIHCIHMRFKPSVRQNMDDIDPAHLVEFVPDEKRPVAVQWFLL